MATKQLLIDAREAKKKMVAVKEWFNGYPYPSTEQDKLAQAVAQLCIDEVKKLKPVDAVEVVRCMDCEFWGGVTFGNVCRRWSAPLAGMKNCTKPDDFCSYGERRTDGDKSV